MRTRFTAVAALACLGVTFLAGCGPKKTPNAGGPTTGAPSSTSSATPPASPSPTVKQVVAGNCTVYPKSDAVKLLGAVNMNNNAIQIGTDGGTKIDVCSYLDVQGLQSIQGVSYVVVRYDSAATAFSKAKKLQSQMLGRAAANNWSVQSLVTAVPGAGQVLGGYGTKTENGVTFSIAVIGTNVGPYLIAALGASSQSSANAKKFALAVFKSVAAGVS